MSQELLDGVYSKLKQDVIFMAFFALSPSSSVESVTNRLVRELEPDATFIAERVPHVQMYIPPGRFGRNHLVYEGKFCFDFYAKSSADARKIAQRAFKLFHDSYISYQLFNSFRCHLAYDTDFATGITGVKGYKAIYDVDYIRK